MIKTLKNSNSSRGRRPSPALIVSVIALVLALTGSALALPVNTVRSKQIVDQTVKTKDLRDAAVTSDKIAAAVVTTEKIADAAVSTDKLAPNAVDSGKIVDFAVANQDLQGNAVTTDKLADNAVESQDIAEDAVGNSELSIVTRTNSVNVANNATGSLALPCAPGERVLSGGGGFPGVPDGTTLATSEAAGGGWVVEGKNTSGSTQTLIVQVTCLR